jgi:hypothetical protein
MSSEFEAFKKEACRPNSFWNQFADRLFETARHHAIRTLELLYDANLSDMFLVDAAQHAGACVELVTKALLSLQNPYLLVAENKIPSLKEAENSEDLFPNTVFMKNASLICQLVWDQKGLRTEAYSFLYNLGIRLEKMRNAAVHAGSVPLKEELASFFVWWIELFAVEYKIDLNKYLTSISALHEFESVKKSIKLAVRRKKQAAQSTWDGIVHNHSEIKTRILKKSKALAEDKCLLDKEAATRTECQTTGRQFIPWFLGYQEINCPICNNKGILSSILQGVEEEYEGPGDFSSYPYYGNNFSCYVCGLKLEDQEISVFNELFNHDIRVSLIETDNAES